MMTYLRYAIYSVVVDVVNQCILPVICRVINVVINQIDAAVTWHVVWELFHSHGRAFMTSP